VHLNNLNATVLNVLKYQSKHQWKIGSVATEEFTFAKSYQLHFYTQQERWGICQFYYVSIIIDFWNF